MKLLAVDTALGACSVAVLDNERVLARRFVPMERGHAEALAPMVDDAMREAGVAFAALERLAVTTGPGTFTGQRVGLAFMRGLRIALYKPLIGITTLEAMARQAMAETGCDLAATLHDAKRGEVYLGIYDAKSELVAPMLAPFAEAIAMIARHINKKEIALAGTAAVAAEKELFARGVRVCPSSVLQPDALWVARCVLTAPETNIAPKPLYLRPSDARLPERPA